MRSYLYRNFPNFAKKCARMKRKLIILAHKHYSVPMMEKYISKKYKQVVGYDMDWENPKSYTQKIQYSKVFNHDARRTTYSDKVAVRDFIKETVGEKYLIPIYGVWNSFSEIDFSKLPNSFVLKTNHGSATNVIVKDKSKLNLTELKKR